MDSYTLNDYTLYHEEDKARMEAECAEIIAKCKAINKKEA